MLSRGKECEFKTFPHNWDRPAKLKESNKWFHKLQNSKNQAQKYALHYAQHWQLETTTHSAENKNEKVGSIFFTIAMYTQLVCLYVISLYSYKNFSWPSPSLPKVCTDPKNMLLRWPPAKSILPCHSCLLMISLCFNVRDAWWFLETLALFLLKDLHLFQTSLSLQQ